MTDPAACTHQHTEPVDVRDRTTGGTRTVARICRGCLTQLHAGWGCPDCDWSQVSIRRLCDPHNVIDYHLDRPCLEHA